MRAHGTLIACALVAAGVAAHRHEEAGVAIRVAQSGPLATPALNPRLGAPPPGGHLGATGPQPGAGPAAGGAGVVAPDSRPGAAVGDRVGIPPAAAVPNAATGAVPPPARAVPDTPARAVPPPATGAVPPAGR